MERRKRLTGDAGRVRDQLLMGRVVPPRMLREDRVVDEAADVSPQLGMRRAKAVVDVAERQLDCANALMHHCLDPTGLDDAPAKSTLVL